MESSFKKGQSLIEILVVIALTAILLPVLFYALMASREGRPQMAVRTRATEMIQETQEIMRVIREKGWSNMSTNGTFYPIASGNTWSLASGTETMNGITRQVVISDVYRLNEQIVTSGGTIDPSTKRAIITVSWSAPIPTSISSTLYLSRYLENASYIQTTKADFDTGSLYNVQTTNTAGGEVTLANNIKAKWCSPAFSTATIDLPDGPPVAVSALASSTSAIVPNDVFTAVAPLTSTSIKLAHVQVSANSDPPVPNLKGIFTLDSAQYSNPSYVPTGIGLTNTFKTNDVTHYKAASGKIYALLATDLASQEIVAVQINNGTGPAYQDPTNHIYKYWTYFNTRIYSSTSGAVPTSTPTLTPTPTVTPTPSATPTPTPIGGVVNTGFLNPAANSADSGGDANGYQTSPTNAYTDNATFATDSNSGSGTGTSCTGSDKDKHRFYNYGFPSLTGGTIQGIEVRLDAKTDNTTGAPKLCVQLSWDGGTSWTTAQSTGTLTTNEAAYTLGASNNTWGRTWNAGTNFTNANFRLRIINVASNTSRDFSLDWATIKVYYSGITPTNTPTPTATLTPTPTSTPTPTPTPTTVPSTNDQAPFGYGAKTVTVLGDRGYIASGGYLYVFDLSNIDNKTTSTGLDQLGCRIQLDGYDCNPGSGTDKKYNAGQTGTTWTDTTSPAHNDCSDGGNIELNATNDLYGVQVGGNTYIYVAVGAGTNPEFEVVNATNVPTSSSSPTVTNSSCGRISGGNAGWKMVGSLDFNNSSNTEEAANSVFGKSDGTRAYISSNGGIDADGNGQPDSKQFYVINTSTKTSPSFLAGSGSGPTSGYYYGTNPNDDLFPRRSLTVLNGERAVLVGQDGFSSNGKNPKDYQVLDITTETAPGYCGGVDYDAGFNDLTSVTEFDHDTFVYMVANTADKELKIIEGGPDGTYMNEGTYESATYNGTYARAFNRVFPTFTQPTNTTVKFQIAIADPVAGSCTGAIFNFTGPGGTSDPTDVYTADSMIALDNLNGGYENPGQCMRYRAFLSSTDYNNTPILQSVSINLSP